MSTNDIFQIPRDFIEEDGKLDRTRQKKGGPYNKKDRHLRRQEVYRLHFEHGYSAVKIAELMKINRHTVDDDISYWYSKLKNNWDELHIESLLLKQILRMEDQRTRLLEQLKNTDSFESKLSLEKMIMESDNRLTSVYLKSRDTDREMLDFSKNTLNKWLEDMQLDVRVSTNHELTILTTETQNKIKKLIDTDKIPTFWRGNHASRENRRRYND